MHWSDLVADELLKRGDSHVIETGTSISGIPHVGNASDVIRGDAVRKALEEKGVKPKLIWVSDDSDPLRKVPKGLEAIKDYLGFPVKDIPDPDGCHKGFVEHFVEPFLSDLAEFGVKPEIYSGTDLYRNGLLYDQIKTAFAKRREIAEILNKFRRDPLPEDYIPWTPICEGCGRISTTRVVSWEGDKVRYVCEDTDVSGGKVSGCGYEGEADIKTGNGKMPWRVEWAARWSHFKVTCEPLGKEHATSGGSYWTSRIVSEQIFGWKPPEPVIYEFFTLNGEKISSSKGNVITLTDWLQLCEPEVLKFFMYKRLQKQRDINLSRITALVDEYDEAERVYFGLMEGEDDLKKHYMLSQVNSPRPLQVPFTLCAVLAQVVPELDMAEIEKRLERHGYLDLDHDRLKARVLLARNWNASYGPEYLRFCMLSEEESRNEFDRLSAEQEKALLLLSEELDKEWTPESLHKRIYEIARSEGLKPPQLFKAVYQVLIGKEKGPKAASFILSLEAEYVKKRFSP